MDYIAVHIAIDDFSDERAEIVMAMIDELGFDSYSVEAPFLNAFIKKDLFNATGLKAILSGFDSQFKVTFTTELIKEENWNAVWESDFEPVVVRDTVTVKAPYHKDLPKTKYNIVINPDMSFGSGHHQTTCMMIEALLSEKVKGKQVLDMGCGTGILGIFAAKLGATVPVHAVDIDPRCVGSTIANARRNRVGHKLSVLCGDSALLQTGRYDIILANINRNILLADMPTYARSLKPAGILFLSGFYTEDIPVLAAEASKYALTFDYQRSNDNWALIRLSK